mgnify:CR=1 FL=1
MKNKINNRAEPYKQTAICTRNDNPVAADPLMFCRYII